MLFTQNLLSPSCALFLLPQVSEISLIFFFLKRSLPFQAVFRLKKKKEYFSSPFCPLCHVEMTYYWIQIYDVISEPTPRGPKIMVTTTKYD